MEECNCILRDEDVRYEEDAKLTEELRALINRNSRERFSNTPDFVIAEYLLGCLRSFEDACERRDILKTH